MSVLAQKQLKSVTVAVILGLAASAPAAVIFDGVPTGQPNGTTLDSLPQWSQSWQTDGAAGYSGTMQNNQVQTGLDGTAGGGSWRYLGFRADSGPGVAQTYDATSSPLHYLIDIDKMIDNGSHSFTTYNNFFTFYLTPEDYSTQPFNSLGEKIAVTVQYNYGTGRGSGVNAWDPNLIVSLLVINKNGDVGEPATDVGTTVATKTFYYTHIDRPDGDPDGDRGSMSLDLQWDDGQGFRLIATPGFASDKDPSYSPGPLDTGWIDPTTVANSPLGDTSAFGLDWKTRWNGDTKFFIENSTAPYGIPVTNLSLVQVTQNVVPEPAGMAIIGLITMGLAERRRR